MFGINSWEMPWIAANYSPGLIQFDAAAAIFGDSAPAVGPRWPQKMVGRAICDLFPDKLGEHMEKLGVKYVFFYFFHRKINVDQYGFNLQQQGF